MKESLLLFSDNLCSQVQRIASLYRPSRNACITSWPINFNYIPLSPEQGFRCTGQLSHALQLVPEQKDSFQFALLLVMCARHRAFRIINCPEIPLHAMQSAHLGLPKRRIRSGASRKINRWPILSRQQIHKDRIDARKFKLVSEKFIVADIGN